MTKHPTSPRLQPSFPVSELSLEDYEQLYQLAVRGLEAKKKDLREVERRLNKAKRSKDVLAVGDIQAFTALGEHYQRELALGRAVCDRLAAYLSGGEDAR